ncbi:unnamed protein product [Sphagnum jensenii]|uniref:Uncharacterized protein n=1 Tax=Sphagnum jensenii TaxID=128206 RepID=A0ABP0VBQ5_9BRYO
MTLSWNLVSRANSVGNVMLQHVDWKEDSMIITFPKHKGDQTAAVDSQEEPQNTLVQGTTGIINYAIKKMRNRTVTVLHVFRWDPPSATDFMLYLFRSGDLKDVTSVHLSTERPPDLHERYVGDLRSLSPGEAVVFSC